MLTAEVLSQVRRIEIRTGKLVAETFAGEYLSVFKGHGMEFAEVREYAPGDDIRSIDWNVTARLGRPFVKRFVEERELTLMLACDISGSQHFGSSGRFKNQAAAELTGLFAFAALQNSDKVGLLLFSDQVELYIPPRKGRRHCLRLIRELLAHKPKSEGTNIGLGIDTMNRVMKRRGILILISDFLGRDFEKPLKMAAKKHDLIPIMLQDPMERKIPRLPVILDTEDPETGMPYTFDLSDEGFHRLYRASAEQRRNDLKSMFSKSGIDWIDIKSSESIVDPVVQFFKERSSKFKG